MMMKQRCLAFLNQESLEALWERFPEPAREEVTQHYARLMARASVERIRALRNHEENREVGDEPNEG